ncbi:hypothetical protein OAR95_00295 [Pseudomonadales bacterium]|nr:hypothetical protein [Pseudomonadales bacterium]
MGSGLVLAGREAAQVQLLTRAKIRVPALTIVEIGSILDVISFRNNGRSS